MIGQLLSTEHADGLVAFSFTGSVLSLERNSTAFMEPLSKNIHHDLLCLSSLLIRLLLLCYILQPSLL